MTWMILLSLSIIFQVIADKTVKDYSINGDWYTATITMTFCIISSAFWMWYMRTHSALALGANIWSVATGIAALLIGVLMYHEPVTAYQYVGIFLGMVSLALIL